MENRLEALEYRFQTLDDFYGDTDSMTGYDWLMNHGFILDARNREKALLLEIGILVKEQNFTKAEYDSVKDKFQSLDFFYEDCLEFLKEEGL